MNFCIVVSRYNENVEWTKQFQNVIIYNKGNPIQDNDLKQVFLSNVGREGHTYYKHIYDNYEKLQDYTIFLQGNPFDHSPNLVQNVTKFINNTDSIMFEFISEHIAKTNLSGDPHHYPPLPLIEVYERLFNERKTSMDITFGSGAQFIVSKDTILRRPRDFYKNIVKMLEYNVNPVEGFVIERFHKIIFEYPH